MAAPGNPIGVAPRIGAAHVKQAISDGLSPLLPSHCMLPSDRERYSRQILFPGIGEAGQEALLRSHVVIAGCGALGSFHATALAPAGVGRLTLIDRDYIEPSNLHRQWLFEAAD